jgi:hypothetical protein
MIPLLVLDQYCLHEKSLFLLRRASKFPRTPMSYLGTNLHYPRHANSNPLNIALRFKSDKNPWDTFHQSRCDFACFGISMGTQSDPKDVVTPKNYSNNSPTYTRVKLYLRPI